MIGIIGVGFREETKVVSFERLYRLINDKTGLSLLYVCICIVSSFDDQTLSSLGIVVVVVVVDGSSTMFGKQSRKASASVAAAAPAAAPAPAPAADDKRASQPSNQDEPFSSGARDFQAKYNKLQVSAQLAFCDATRPICIRAFPAFFFLLALRPTLSAPTPASAPSSATTTPFRKS